MTKLVSNIKSRDVTLPTKVHIYSQSYGFPVVMYGYESWTIKKAEYQRIDAFELWCWRRFLRVPWTARRSNRSILKEISPEYSLEGLMLKLKLQYFGLTMQRANSLEKPLMLGKIEGRRRRGGQRERWLAGITDSMDMSLSKLKGREAWCAAAHWVTKSRTWLWDWTTTTHCLNYRLSSTSCQIRGAIRFSQKNQPYSTWISPKPLSHPWKHCVPQNQSLVPKRLGTAALM